MIFFQKVESDPTQLLCLAVPVWPTQAWWPTLPKLNFDKCVTLRRKPQKKQHPLQKKKIDSYIRSALNNQGVTFKAI